MAWMFNLWNLYRRADDHFAFDVTRANMPRIKAGTREFVEACLRAFDVDAHVRSWSVTPIRTHYFTDYGDSEDWEGRWQIGWHVEVNVEPSVADGPNVMRYLPRHVDGDDPTWDGDEEDPGHDRTVLFITVHQGDRASAERFATELLAQVAATGLPVQATTDIRSFVPPMHQVRVTLQGAIFPASVEVMDALLDHCRRAGAVTNWREVPESACA